MNNNFSEENVFFFGSKNNSGDRSTNIQVPLSHSNGKGTAPQVLLRPSVGNGAATQVPLRPTVGNGAANQVPQRHPNGNGTAIRASQRHTIGNGEAMVCTPPGSDVDFNSTDESESLDPPLEGYTQLGPIVFSIRKALFTMNRARGDTTGNTPILCQEALDLNVLRCRRNLMPDRITGLFTSRGSWHSRTPSSEKRHIALRGCDSLWHHLIGV